MSELALSETIKSLYDTVLDLSAGVMALAELGVEKGLWTEQEFIAKKMRAQTLIDEDLAARRDERENDVCERGTTADPGEGPDDGEDAGAEPPLDSGLPGTGGEGGSPGCDDSPEPGDNGR